MDVILSQIPGWVYSICLLLVVLGGFVLFFKKRLFIKTKNIKIGNGNSENIYLVINKSIRINDEICEIKYRKRLDEQMSFCEDLIEAIRRILLQNFMKMLERKNVINIMSCQEYKSYEKITYVLLDNMKSICRKRFKEMSDVFNKVENIHNTYEFIKPEFEEYKSRTVKFILQRATEIITQEWIDNNIISREENYEQCQPILENIAKNVSDVFQNAIEVQLKFNQKIKDLDSEMKEFIKNLNG